MMAWLRRVGAALKRYWWAALGSALIAACAIWRIFAWRSQSAPQAPSVSTVPVAEAVEAEVAETRAVIAAQLTEIGQAEQQVEQKEQDAHAQIRNGGGDTVDKLLYGRKIDGG
jgi:thiol:disulfide interchange protein